MNWKTKLTAVSALVVLAACNKGLSDKQRDEVRAIAHQETANIVVYPAEEIPVSSNIAAEIDEAASR